MTCRRATEADRASLVRMGVRFLAESSYRGQFVGRPEAIDACVGYVLAQGAFFVAECPDCLACGELVGMFGVVVAPHPMTWVLTATEICWWVEPEYRGIGRAAVRLFDAAEAWAREQGAEMSQVVRPAGAIAVERFYRRRGYGEVETVFSKPLAA